MQDQASLRVMIGTLSGLVALVVGMVFVLFAVRGLKYSVLFLRGAVTFLGWVSLVKPIRKMKEKAEQKSLLREMETKLIEARKSEGRAVLEMENLKSHIARLEIALGDEQRRRRHELGGIWGISTSGSSGRLTDDIKIRYGSTGF